MKNKYQQYRKRIFAIILLLQVAFIFSDEGELHYMEEPEIINATHFDVDGSPLLEGIFDSNECLMAKAEAKSILEKDYGVKVTPDEKQRFILGKCNPVLFVNGIFASRLAVSVNCKKLKAEEPDKFMDTRVFCGETVCKDENNENDEQVLFPALLDSAFTLLDKDGNKYSSCTGYFMQFFNNKNECPKMENGKNVCMYSDNVRIKYYGGTANTKDKARCGLKAVDNVIYAGNAVLEAGVNQGAAKVFHEMIAKFKKMGYDEGFSMAAVPQDYRRFATTNKFANEAFKYQINQLYANTGKPVIIIGHSYGTLLSLSQLLQFDKTLLGKVKRFIALAPPFAGASKLEDVFLYGHRDFNVDIHVGDAQIFKVNFDTFGQSMIFKSLPVISELRPLPVVNELFTNENYTEFGEAVKERLELETTCANKNCDAEYVKTKSKKFSALFGSTFPSLSDDVCKISSSKNKNALKALLNKNAALFSTPCRSNMYNMGLCPASIYKTKDYAPTTADFAKNCENYGNANLLFDKKCDGKGSCLDDIYKKPPYGFADSTKLNYLIDRFNKNYASKFGKTIDKSYFESQASFNEKSQKMLEYHSQTSILRTRSLPAPPVDTTVLYTNFIPTSSGFILDQTKTQEKLPDEQILEKGGDGTVPNWSSYLIGLKWLYDKKKKGLKQDITLVEYCSPLSKSGSKFAYKEGTTKKFYAIGCDCLDANNSYKSFKGCNHAGMLSDNKLIDYLKTIIYNKNDATGVTEGKKAAVANYKKDKDYVSACNNKLRALSDL